MRELLLQLKIIVGLRQILPQNCCLSWVVELWFGRRGCKHDYCVTERSRVQVPAAIMSFLSKLGIPSNTVQSRYTIEEYGCGENCALAAVPGQNMFLWAHSVGKVRSCREASKWCCHQFRRVWRLKNTFQTWSQKSYSCYFCEGKMQEHDQFSVFEQTRDKAA